MSGIRNVSAVLVAAVLFPLSARAQTQGAGFPIGEKSRVHTHLDVGVGFDSNPDRTDDAATVASDWKALIRPGLAVAVPGSSFSLDLKTQLTINQYFGTSTSPTDTTFGLMVGAALSAGSRTSVVAFKLDDQLVRTPAYLDDAGTIAAEERLFKAWSNRGTAALILRPGGGALEFNLGYTNLITGFDNTLPFSQRHGALLEAKLRFLPKTAAVFHADFSYFTTDEAATTADATPYNVTLGLIGQITPRLSTHLALGFGDTLTWVDGVGSEVSDNNERNLIATAELTFDINESSRLAAGYRRQVQPVILLDNFRRDAFFARAVVGLGARLAITLYGQYELRDYTGGLSDAQLLTGDARLDYWFFEFLSAAANYRILMQNGEDQVAGMSDNRLLLNYTRHEFFVIAGLHY